MPLLITSMVALTARRPVAPLREVHIVLHLFLVQPLRLALEVAALTLQGMQMLPSLQNVKAPWSDIRQRYRTAELTIRFVPTPFYEMLVRVGQSLCPSWLSATVLSLASRLPYSNYTTALSLLHWTLCSFPFNYSALLLYCTRLGSTSLDSTRLGSTRL